MHCPKQLADNMIDHETVLKLNVTQSGCVVCTLSYLLESV